MGRGPGSGPTYLDTPGPTRGSKNHSRPPASTHDWDALLTIQFDLVQGASGPLHTTNSMAQWAGGGHSEDDDGCGNDQSCQDILSTH